MKTPWAEAFGDQYTERNRRDQAKVILFWKVALLMLSRARVKSAIELGANRGHNLLALPYCLPSCARFDGVETNEAAFLELAKVATNAYPATIEEFSTDVRYDLVLTRGVLIHIRPEVLRTEVYPKIASLAKRYVLMAEYYSPQSREIDYRDDVFCHARDFAGEFMEQFPEFALLDYGFVYRGDAHLDEDDVTWFLMERETAP